MHVWKLNILFVRVETYHWLGPCWIVSSWVRYRKSEKNVLRRRLAMTSLSRIWNPHATNDAMVSNIYISSHFYRSIKQIIAAAAAFYLFFESIITRPRNYMTFCYTKYVLFMTFKIAKYDIKKVKYDIEKTQKFPYKA